MANSANKNTPDSKTLKDTLAVSLKYDGSNAPQVTAKGTGNLAQKIIELAKENQVPIQQDAELTELLSQVEIDQQIPPILYEAVAKILVFAYSVADKEPPLPR